MKYDIGTLTSLLACKANKHNFSRLWGVISREDRLEMAQSEDTPVSIMKALSTDKSCYVREWVARNRSTPIEILKKLINDLDFYVKASAAKNPNLVNKL